MQETEFGLEMENERQHEIKFTFLLTLPLIPNIHPPRKDQVDSGIKGMG